MLVFPTTKNKFSCLNELNVLCPQLNHFERTMLIFPFAAKLSIMLLNVVEDYRMNQLTWQ